MGLNWSAVDSEVSNMVTAEINEHFVGFVKGMPRLLKMQAFQKLMEGHVSSPLDLSRVLTETRSIFVSRLGCDQAVSLSYREALSHTASLAPLRPIHDFAKSWDAAEYKEKERSVEQFRVDMVVLRYAASSYLTRGHRQ